MKYPDIKAPKEQLTFREKLSQWWFGDVIPILEAIAFPAFLILTIVIIILINLWR